MEKKIEDYLPYYIGQDIQTSDGSILKIVSVHNGGWINASGQNVDGKQQVLRGYLSEEKLRLRPLSCMVEEEMKELHILFFDPSSREIYTQKIKKIVFYIDEPRRHIKHGTGIGYTTLDENSDHISSGTLSFSRFNAIQFHYLLKQGFDLFGLIEAGLAVDKTKEVTNGNQRD